VGDPFPVTTLHSPSLMIPGYVSDVEISVSRKNLVLTLGELSGGIWITSITSARGFEPI
jgi:hypothetical protein